MEYPKEIKNRLKRIEGQIRGVLRLMEEQKECNDIIHQLSAIKSAVDRTTVHVVGLDMKKCLVEDLQKNKDDRDTDKLIEDMLRLLLKTK